MPKTPTNKLQFEIAQQILNLCRLEDWPVGQRLTERALAERFQVSRSPVRLALDLLVEHSVVERTPQGRYVLAASGRELEATPIELPRTDQDWLHETILRDRFAERIPNQVTEADLLRRYQTTRGVLLKALVRLSQEGMIDRSHGHGWIFRKILNSVEAYQASYELRLAIEPLAIRSPNFKIDHNRVNRLIEIHRALRDGKIANLTGSKQFDLDAELHETIASFSGNEFFVEIVQRQNQLRRVAEYELFYASDPMSDSHESHLEILEALRDGDTELAAAAMQRHLLVSRRLIRIFRHHASEPEPVEGVSPKAAGERAGTR